MGIQVEKPSGGPDSGGVCRRRVDRLRRDHLLDDLEMAATTGNTTGSATGTTPGTLVRATRVTSTSSTPRSTGCQQVRSPAEPWTTHPQRGKCRQRRRRPLGRSSNRNQRHHFQHAGPEPDSRNLERRLAECSAMFTFPATQPFSIQGGGANSEFGGAAIFAGRTCPARQYAGARATASCSSPAPSTRLAGPILLFENYYAFRLLASRVLAAEWKSSARQPRAVL